MTLIGCSGVVNAKVTVAPGWPIAVINLSFVFISVLFSILPVVFFLVRRPMPVFYRRCCIVLLVGGFTSAFAYALPDQGQLSSDSSSVDGSTISAYETIRDIIFEAALGAGWYVDAVTVLFQAGWFSGGGSDAGPASSPGAVGFRPYTLVSLVLASALVASAVAGSLLGYKWEVAAGLQVLIFALFFTALLLARRRARVLLVYKSAYGLLSAVTFCLLAAKVPAGGCLWLVHASQYAFNNLFYLLVVVRRDSRELRKSNALLLQGDGSSYDGDDYDDNTSGAFGTEPMTPRAGPPASPGPSSSLGHALAGEVLVDVSEVKLGAQVGAGQYGDVFSATWRGRSVAAKRFRVAGSISDKLMNLFQREVGLLASLSHPNVLAYVGTVVTDTQLMLLTEYVSGGALFDYIGRAPPDWPVADRLRTLDSIAAGMEYLHARHSIVIHRDLKSHNILVEPAADGSAALVCKVCDLGVSRLKQVTSTMTTVGTPQWMSPESLRGEKYSEKTDVFSFAIVAWEVMTLKRPFPSVPPLRVANLVAHEGLRLPIPTATPQAIARLIEDCWDERPQRRPSFSQIRARIKAMIK
jgi:hypothetical protein